jgi:conjugal transfer/entry exclusion protein
MSEWVPFETAVMAKLDQIVTTLAAQGFSLTHLEESIVSLKDELNVDLAEVKNGTAKVVDLVGRLQQQVSDLSGQVAAGNDAAQQLSEASDTLAQLRSAADDLNNLVPDAPAPTPEPPANP